MWIKMIRRHLLNQTLLMVILLTILTIIVTDCRHRKSRRHSNTSSLHRMTRKRGVEIKFSCIGRPVGYYADPDFDCHIFHICDNFGRRIPMRCPAQTMFNQMYRVCDWEYNVDCKDSANWYHVNSNTFEREERSVPSESSSSAAVAAAPQTTTTVATTTVKDRDP